MKKGIFLLLAFTLLIPIISPIIVQAQGTNISLTSAFHSGSNQSDVFTLDDTFYLADMKDSSKRFYLNFSEILENNYILKLFARKSSGVAIGIYSHFDTLGNNPLGNFTVTSASGEWINVTLNISTPTESIWLGEGNSSGTDPKDDFDFIQAINPDTTPPYLILFFPINTTYTSTELQINFSAQDTNLHSCWYSDNLGITNITLPNCANTTYSSNQGSTSISLYANDTLGNTNLSTVTFFTDSITPLITYNPNTLQDNSIITYNSIYINVSVTETNEANITFSLSNSTSIYNSTNFLNAERTINFTNLPDDTYSFNVTITDILNNINSTSTRTITIDSTSPSITITEPQNTTSTSSSFQINFSAQDTNLQSCWYSDDSGTTNISLPNCDNSTYSSSQGSTTLIIYANDSSNNQNSNSITFFVDSISPTISIAQPQADSTFGTNTSLELKFSASDTNLQSCWYNIDNSDNISISNCANTTFNSSASATTLHIFANDTLGNSISSSVNFSITLGAPSIVLTSPKSEFINTRNVTFFYTSTDIDLDSCHLWGDFSGTYSINQINSTPTSGQQSFFILNLSDNSYIWNVECNDTQGNSAINGNQSFTVDTTPPTFNLTQPSGTITSRENIPLHYNTTDENINACWYNVFEGITEKISNTTINCSLFSAYFNLTSDADFSLNLFANDSAGNLASISSSFTINTNTGGDSSGNSGGSGSGGGGGGGGGGAVISNPTLSVDENRELSISLNPSSLHALKRGTSSTFNIEVTNNERSFLNSCSLSFTGSAGSWLSNSKTEGLSTGERSIFTIIIDIPENTEPGDYQSLATLKCEEGKQSISIQFTIFRNNFEAKISNYERTSDLLRIFYTLEEFEQENHEITLSYELKDPTETIVATGSTLISLNSEDKQENTLEFRIPKDISGEHDLKLTFSDSTSTTEVSRKIIIQPTSGILGLAISDTNRRTLSIFGILVGATIVIFFVSKLIYNRVIQNKVPKKIEHKHGKRVIKLDLKDK